MSTKRKLVTVFVAILVVMAGIAWFRNDSRTKCCACKGKVILLDGTSSVGKSAIIEEFRKLHPEYQIVKVDDWFPLDLKEIAERLGWSGDSAVNPWQFLKDYYISKDQYYLDTRLRTEIFKGMKSRGYMDEAKKRALHGNNVIIDTVLEDSTQYAIFEETFKDVPTEKVLVYCPLAILFDRVEKRNASADAAEHRTAFLSFEQFPALYKVRTSDSERLVDTVSTQELASLLGKSLEQLRALGIPAGYESELAQFEEQFISHFDIKNRDKIELTPTRLYDRVLNSGSASPSQLAQEL